MNSNENLAPSVVARILKDIRSLCKSPPEGITVSFSEENISNIFADIDGPQGTPYEGGLFRVRLSLGADFPQSPPKGYFITKIFHPNVSEAGEICVNTLKKDWKPTLGIDHVLIVIRCLLIEPNPESALNPDAGKLLLEAYTDFAKRAQMFTRIHAKPRAAAKSDSISANSSQTTAAKKVDATSKPPVPAAASPLKKAMPNVQKAAPVKKTGLKRL